MEWTGATFRVAVLAKAAALRAGLAALLIEAGLALATRFSRLEELPDTPVDYAVLVWAPDPGELREISAALRTIPDVALLLLVRAPDDFRRIAAAIGPRPWGLLPLEAAPEELLAAVRALSEGLTVANPDLLDQSLTVEGGHGEGEQPLPEPLTPREIEVLQRLAEGLTNKQIAYVLGISEHTAKFHISSIYSKLGVMNRAEAVHVGVRYGLIIV